MEGVPLDDGQPLRQGSSLYRVKATSICRPAKMVSGKTASLRLKGRYHEGLSKIQNGEERSSKRVGVRSRRGLKVSENLNDERPRGSTKLEGGGKKD